MAEVQFIGPPAKDAEGRPQGTSRLVNMYAQPGERSPVVLRQVPGMRYAGALGGFFCRAMETIDGELYLIHNARLMRITAERARVPMMDVADDPETTLDGLEGYFLTVAQGSYKVFTPALAVSTPGVPFGTSASAVVLSRRAVVTEKDGRQFAWSDVGNPTSMPALNFATAEQTDDPIIRAYVVGGELWMLKGTCIERWWASGGDPAFTYVAGSLLLPGLKAFRLICQADAGAFFVGSDNRAYLATAGGGLTRVSSPVVETFIAAGEPAACLRTRYGASEILSIIFRDRPAWSLDLQSGQWHERAQGPDLGPWRVAAAAEAYGLTILGNDSGDFYTLDAVGVDGGAAMHRLMVSTTFQQERRPFRVPKLEVQGHVGRGSVTDARDRAPQVRLRTSGDFGQTWTERLPRSLGEEGQYGTRVLWRALGQYRAFTAELRCAEPLDVTFDATAFMELA